MLTKVNNKNVVRGLSLVQVPYVIASPSLLIILRERSDRRISLGANSAKNLVAFWGLLRHFVPRNDNQEKHDPKGSHYEVEKRLING